jgi:probable F420-dependent oxidoreductase
MKFGVNILNFGPGATPELLERWARFAEELGYHFVMISDHVAITPDVQTQFPAPFYDPFVSLGWIAAMTDKVELGTTVTILPYRHPLQTARLATNLDQISSGRFILGVGVGWAKQEFEALGIPFDQRGALTSEYLEAIKLCWSEDLASFEGQFISFSEVQTGPRPKRASSLPIWVGGSSTAALRRAVRYGDAWHPYRFSIDWLKEKALPKLAEIAGIEEKPLPALCPRLSLRLTDSPLPDRRRPAGHGSIKQIGADLAALAALGAEYILLDSYTGRPEQTMQPEKDWEMLRILADNVLDLKNQNLRTV